MAVEPDVRPHRIELQPSLGSRYEEGVADESGIKPGMLLERKVTNWPNGLKKHSTPNQRDQVMIALEDALQGKTINDAFENDPAGDGSVPGDVVGYLIPARGSVVMLLLDSDEVAYDTDMLVSAGDGTVKVATGTDVTNQDCVAEALEDLDLTSKAPAHIKARIL